MSAPGYWMNEMSGALRPAVEAYLHDEPMTARQIAAFRAYCAIGSPTTGRVPKPCRRCAWGWTASTVVRTSTTGWSLPSSSALIRFEF